jgi:microcystin-dependent protein
MCRATWSTLSRTLTASLLAAGVTLGAPRADAGVEPYFGEIMFVPFEFCPKGWLPADGRSMNISANTALFSLLGTTYGGDGRTTFELPDLRGQIVDPGRGPDRKRKITACIAVQGVYPSGP